MRLPPDSILKIADSKIHQYLLNPEHPDGKAKADFFMANGIDAHNAAYLKNALKQQALNNEARSFTVTAFGEKYVFESEIRFPNGKDHLIRSVWIKGLSGKTVKFVTAYKI